MISPIYKFELTSTYGQTTETRDVHPVYKSDLSIDWQTEENGQYFRGKLSGKLNFIDDDFDYINSWNFETEFRLRIYISYDAGESWSSYWNGRFFKTDCEFDVDNKKITVTPDVYDDYVDVVDGLEKEYNLIDLAPEILPVKIDKRPMIQIYSPGESVIACFLSGMYWEQDAKEVDNELELISTYNFEACPTARVCVISGNLSPDATGVYVGTFNDVDDEYEYTNGDYTLYADIERISPSQRTYRLHLKRTGESGSLWSGLLATVPGESYTLALTPVIGSGATGVAFASVSIKKVYARYLVDVDEIRGIQTVLLPTDDITSDNRNYHRSLKYPVDSIYYSTRLLTTPTKYGIYQPGLYYAPPETLIETTFYPIAKSAWNNFSLWFTFSPLDWALEEEGRQPYILKDAYTLSSAISVLLSKIAPGVSHEATAEYSEFLYSDSNPITHINVRLFLTQKSNILAGNYDQPAQKAPVTLKMILEMLRDCFRCYWFIDRDDDDNIRLRIEHISWFANGGSYSLEPLVGIDLTKMFLTRNGKNWSFATSKYDYEKSQMPERYEFGWMDGVTDIFEGNAIEVVSRFVEKGLIESVKVTNFTSDIDYMLLNPGKCSSDGFALMAAVKRNMIQNTETYTMGGSVTFRSVVPDDWKERHVEIAYSLSGGTFDFKVVRRNSEIVETGYTSGTGIISIDIPNDAISMLFVNGTSGEVLQVLSVHNEDYALPYVNFEYNNSSHYVQNAYAAFYFLQLYYMWDMPARDINVENYSGPYVVGVKKLKKQTLQIPTLQDINLYRLVKTDIGNGQIEKVSLNLSSRIAKTTLAYDTE